MAIENEPIQRSIFGISLAQRMRFGLAVSSWGRCWFMAAAASGAGGSWGWKSQIYDGEGAIGDGGPR